VDFGYILGSFPGNLKCEANSFKLSNEFIDKINGKHTENFEHFKELFLRGSVGLKRNFPKLIILLKSFSFRSESKPNVINTIKNFEKRFNLHLNDKKLMKHSLILIRESIENWRTLQYDKYQLHTSGIN
jgi:phosphatidylinositol kinase/protein kinase (PI-3  family)